MPEEAGHPEKPGRGKEKAPAPRPPLARSLSAKVLALTVAFIVFGVAFVFLPSIAGFRITWLKNRMTMAEVATLAVAAAPEQKLSDNLRRELLRSAGVRVVAVRRDGSRHLILHDGAPLMAEARYDLRGLHWWRAIGDAFETLHHGGRRIITVVDSPPNIPGEFIELALDERPLYRAVVNHSLIILKYSLGLAAVVAFLLYVAIHWLLIRPIRRLSAAMARFDENPEDAGRIIRPSGRRDELGMAERQMAQMQAHAASLLKQKNRLAALGLAVSKISHELRNMLTSAQMISDRLAMVDDPTVKKFAPKLIDSLDRAIDFCAGTLKYGRAKEAPPRRERVDLRRLAEEVFESLPRAEGNAISFVNATPEGLFADADPGQLFRILSNLAVNANQALRSAECHDGPAEIIINAWREGPVCVISVKDTGPGLPPQAREHLFEAFTGSARRGGTGLGLSIARELARAHGGDLTLVSPEGRGAEFHVRIPDRAIGLPGGEERRAGSAG